MQVFAVNTIVIPVAVNSTIKNAINQVILLNIILNNTNQVYKNSNIFNITFLNIKDLNLVTFNSFFFLFFKSCLKFFIQSNILKTLCKQI